MNEEKLKDIIQMIDKQDIVDEKIINALKELTLEEKQALEKYYQDRNVELREDIEEYRNKIEAIREKIYKLRNK